jgi:FkbM family methyltransferase
VDTINTVLKNPVGRVIFGAVKPFLRLGRRLAHPGIPDDHQITKVSYRGKNFSIEHRRWSDKVIVDECFRESQYDLPTGEQGKLADSLYKKIIDSGRIPLVIDCGSNIGVSVLWLTARYPEAHVVAIEPGPDNFALLQRNCSGLKVDLRNAGIGAEDGIAHLDVRYKPGYAYQTNFNGEGLATEIFSLKTILASKPESQYTPFLLKVDIEGAEQYLFSKDHDVLNQFPVILIEPHDQFFPGKGTSLEFFRFHSERHREFAMNRSTIASVALDSAPADADGYVREVA